MPKRFRDNMFMNSDVGMAVEYVILDSRDFHPDSRIMYYKKVIEQLQQEITKCEKLEAEYDELTPSENS